MTMTTMCNSAATSKGSSANSTTATSDLEPDPPWWKDNDNCPSKSQNPKFENPSLTMTNHDNGSSTQSTPMILTFVISKATLAKVKGIDTTEGLDLPRLPGELPRFDDHDVPKPAMGFPFEKNYFS